MDTPTNQKSSTAMMVGIIVLVVIVLAGIAYAVLRNDSKDPEDATNESAVLDENSMDLQANVTNTPTPTPSTAAVKSFTLTGQNFRFTPAEIRVKQGDTVRVTLSNTDTMPHDWQVDQFNAKTKVITNGQQDTVEFVANTAGTFEYYCGVGQHRQQGMVGTLIVE